MNSLLNKLNNNSNRTVLVHLLKCFNFVMFCKNRRRVFVNVIIFHTCAKACLLYIKIKFNKIAIQCIRIIRDAFMFSDLWVYTHTHVHVRGIPRTYVEICLSLWSISCSIHSFFFKELC